MTFYDLYVSNVIEKADRKAEQRIGLPCLKSGDDRDVMSEREDYYECVIS